MANPRKVTIDSDNFGTFEGDNFSEVIEKAAKEFAQYTLPHFEIDLVEVDGYYLHETSVEQIQMDIEEASKKYKVTKD